MVVIRLSKVKKKIFFINVIYKKKSVFGNILKRLGYYDPFINYGKSFFINYKLLFFYVKNGAKISKRIYFFLKK
ncbi:30S ribosomal protein S16 [Candidatus Carsonella ruddii]|uniref:Ribosomal protein S16 n=1 Tax=Candidatus Carsonella ruddii HC isolate Thao2000 TaxID=1202538 RepID=J3VPZ1_CARRU|nr:30S ribosomal protein S16 [Candidatus Carsonella ruddii]AFP83991.1 ribosomal protein S16 [Candidatus Carsonella ruddii HC isolate Thao2000]